MDAVTEADIVRQLVKFAIDGDLCSVAACVRIQRRAIDRRHLRIRNYEVAVEEELQHSDAGSGDGSMSRGIRGMRGRAFGKRLGQEVGAVLVEAALHGLRVQDVVMRVAL